jgi:membrane fusion protein (multidrug efflux system)
MSRGRIVAPFDGVVTHCNGSAGDYVRGGDASREPILTVMRIDILRVVVGIPERYSALAKKGIPAEVLFDALPAFRDKVTVARVGVEVNKFSKTIRAEIEVPNPRGMLRPGMTGGAILNLGSGPVDAVRVPPSAVFRLRKEMEDGEKRWGIYVYRDGKARLLKVRSDYSNRDEIEVIGGLTRDDLVIIDPLQVVRDQNGLPDELPIRAELPPTKK